MRSCAAALLCLALVLTAHAGQNPDINIFLEFDNGENRIDPAPFEPVTVTIYLENLGPGSGVKGTQFMLVRSFSGVYISHTLLQPSWIEIGDPETGWMMAGPCATPDGEGRVALAEVTYFYDGGSPGTLEIVDYPLEPRLVVDCLDGEDYWCVRQSPSGHGGVWMDPPPGDCPVSDLHPHRMDVPSEYPTIADGIAAAGSGDTVLVSTGVYVEYGLAPKEFVTLMGVHPDSVWINADYMGRVFDINEFDCGPSTVISGFTITGGFDIAGGGGMYCHVCTLTVSDCVFFNNSGNVGAGVWVNGGAPTFTDCEFVDNQIAADGGGMSCTGSGSPLIQDCTFEGNWAERGGGIQVSAGSHPTIQYTTFKGNYSDHGGGLYCDGAGPEMSLWHLTFYGNVANFDGGGATLIEDIFVLDHCTFYANSCPGDGGGIACYGANLELYDTIVAGSGQGEAVYGDGLSPVMLYCCDVYGNAGGDYVGPIAGQNGTLGNIAQDPIFCGPGTGDLTLQACSPCLDAPGCGQIGRWGQGCLSRIWNVPGDAPTIAAAIDSAAKCDTIIVASGTYHETNLVMKSGITLRGATGIPDDVIIDAGSTGRVFYCADLDTTTVISGFTITGGDTISGGGMWCKKAPITVEDCIFSHNSVTGGGGAVLADSSDVKFVSCVFDSNSSGSVGGGIQAGNSDLELVDCDFTDNSAWEGGGIAAGAAVSSELLLTGCTFSGNRAINGGGGDGGGLHCVSIEAVIDGCTFADNVAENSGGGVNAMMGGVDMIGSTFTGNAAGLRGGAVFATISCSLALTGCTLADNESVDGAGLNVYGGSLATLENTIIAFGDSGVAVTCPGGGILDVSCCDIYGNYGGDYVDCLAGYNGTNGNFSEDPLFCDPGDYRLKPASPCLDAPGCGLVGALGVAGGCGGLWTVPGDVPTIAAALDSAAVGDTVLVSCGTYYEHDLVIKSGVTLRSATGQADCVTIIADDGGRIFYCLGVDTTAVIKGFTGTATGYWNEIGGGIYCELSSPKVINCEFYGHGVAPEGGGVFCGAGSSPTFTNCSIHDNEATAGGGVALQSGSSPRFVDCVISDNVSFSNGGGVNGSSGDTPTFTDCVVSSNVAADAGGGMFVGNGCMFTLTGCTLDRNGATGDEGGGLALWGSLAEATLDHCIVSFSTQGSAAWCFGGEIVTATCSDVYGNAGGDYVDCLAGQDGMNGNFSEDPIFCGPSDYHLRAASPCLWAPTCGQVGALGLGTGCSRTWWVPDDAPTIAAAIDSAVVGDTVLVMPDTYYEYDLEMKSGIVVMGYGGDPSAVIIDPYEGVGWTRRVFYCNGVDSTSVISGFTITGGDTLYGGGMLCENGSDLTISDCIFHLNSAWSTGGGLYCNDSDPTIVNCTFSENMSGGGSGGVELVNSNPDIAYCTFADNYGPTGGGGLRCTGSSPTVMQCEFIGNDCDDGPGGGVACELGASPFFDGCTFTGNATVSGAGGGVASWNSNPHFEYCVIAGNSAAAGGGGLFASSGALTMTSCTIAGNGCTQGAGVFLTGGSLGFLHSTIIASNVSGEPVYCEGGSILASASCLDVFGNEFGDYIGCLTGQEGINGNFSEDPKFCDPAGGNYYLHVSSPCADVMGCSQVGALGVGCGRVWNVPLDAPTVAAGIDSAAAGDTVLVECGTYYEHGLTLKSGIYLTSETGLADCVTIDSGLDAGIFYCDGVDSTTVVKGFSVTGAGDGGDTQGNGLYLTHSDPKVINCEFYGHEYVAYGPAVYCEYSSPFFGNCSFHDNQGASGCGMYLALNSAPMLLNCSIYNNASTIDGAGIACNEGSSPTLVDCSIYANIAEDYGAGLFCADGCTVAITGSSFALNAATRGDGGGIACISDMKSRAAATVTVDHSIIAFSGAGVAAFCAGSGNVTLTCCDVYGNAGGDYVSCLAGQNGINGNISQDPEFCDMGSSDFTLRTNSPCAAHNSGCGQMGPLGVGCESCIDWVAGGDGISWSDSSNWSPPDVPGINDHARITPAWDDTVEISENEIVWRLTVGCDSGSVVLNIPSPDTLTSTHGTTNCGTIQVFGDGAYRQLGPVDDETFMNMDDALFRLDNGDLIGSGEFQNWGEFRKTGGLLSKVSLSHFWNASDELYRRGGYFACWAGSLDMEASASNDGSTEVNSGAVVFVPSHRGGAELRQGDDFTNGGSVWVDGEFVLESGAALVNNGSFADSGVVRVNTGGQFTNNDDGTFDLRGDLLGNGQFTNWGTFEKTGGGLSRMTPDFLNASDELLRRGGYFAARTGTLDMESSVSNDGQADVNGGAVVFVPSHRGGLEVRQDEQFINAGSVTVQSGGEFVVASLAEVSNSGTFADSGVTRLNTGGQFTNEAGGTFNLADGDLLGSGYFENWGDFYKTGPHMSRITPEFLNGFDVKLRRTGYFNAVSGSTSVESGMSNDGDMDVNGGAITFVPSHRGGLGDRLASLTSSGTLTVEAGGELVNRSTTTIDSGGMFINEGLTRTDGGAQFANYGTATIDGSGEYRNSGTTTVHGTGEFEIDVIAAKVRNLPSGAFYLSGGDVSGLYNGGTEAGGFENLGEVVKTGPDTSMISAPFRNLVEADAVGILSANAGVLRLESTCANAGTVHVFSGALVEFDPFRIDVFENEGWLQVHGTGELTIGSGRADPNATFVNIGTARIDSAGQITNDGSFNHKENAVLTGEGTFDTSGGNAAMKGLIQPGSSTGILRFMGDFYQTGTSEISVELGGETAGAHTGGYDQLDITGTAVFDGAVDVDLVGDYEPELADSFHVIVLNGQPAFRDTSYTGDFVCYSGLELPDSLYLAEVEQPAKISLVVTQVGTGNNPPGAAADEDSTYGYGPVTLYPLTNDTDGDADDLRIVSVIPVPGTTRGGILIDEGDTTLTYLPEFGYEGLDTFAYNITDCQGGLDTAPFVMEITAPARTWLVPSEAPTIQAGVDSAGAGDTVLVEPGDYGPGATRDALPIVMKSGIRLMSAAGAEVTSIDAGGMSRVFYCADVDSTTSIEGFTIGGGESPGAEPADWGGGMVCLSSSPRIVGCVFSGNAATIGGAISCQNGSSPLIEGCAFEANTGTVEGGGVACHVGSMPAIDHCTFVGNDAPTGAGVLVSGSSHVALARCTFSDNAAPEGGGGAACYDGSAVLIDRSIIAFSSAGAAVHCDETSEALASCTDIYGNVGGDWEGSIAPQASENGNFSLDPEFCDAVAEDYHLAPTSPCADAPGCGLVGALPAGCLGEPGIEVDPEWLLFSAVQGGTACDTLFVMNSGRSNLWWWIYESGDGEKIPIHPVPHPLNGRLSERLVSSRDAAIPGDDPYHVELGKGDDDPRDGFLPERGAGGPDTFGYTWIDSDEPGGPEFEWSDITTVGTPVALADDGSARVPLPFTFPYYATGYGSVRISSNGYLTFGMAGDAYINQPIPSTFPPNAVVAPFWDDLEPQLGGTIHYYADAEAGLFTVQYTDIQRFAGTGTYTFQVILTWSGEIYFQYLDVEGELGQATTGVESPDGTVGLEIAFNAAYAHESLAVRIMDPYPWITEAPPEGITFGLGSEAVTVCADASELGPGTYGCHLAITSNDPEGEPVRVPITLFVLGPAIDVFPESLEFTVQGGDSDSDTLVVSNVGSAELEWSLSEVTGALVMGDGRTIPVRVLPSRDGVGTQVAPKAAVPGADGRTADAPIRLSPVAVADGAPVSRNGDVYPWLSQDPTSGTTVEGASQEITVTVDASQLGEGEYDAYIAVDSNDLERSRVTVPVVVFVVGTGVDDEELPSKYVLHGTFPNPFNPATTIRYDLPQRVDVSLRIYNLTGRVVRELMDGTQEPGYYAVPWNGRDDDGRTLASGVYFCRLEAGGEALSTTMILLK